MTSQFNRFVNDDGSIDIDYWYGDYNNGISQIKFTVPDLDKIFSVRYTGSSMFALWWCGLTDGNEEDDEIPPPPATLCDCVECA